MVEIVGDTCHSVLAGDRKDMVSGGDNLQWTSYHGLDGGFRSYVDKQSPIVRAK
jgi:hypothetical protein